MMKTKESRRQIKKNIVKREGIGSQIKKNILRRE